MDAAQDYDSRVTSFVEDDSELTGYVARLESIADAGELDDDDDEDRRRRHRRRGAGRGHRAQVDRDDLIDEVERFLRDQRDAG